MNDRMKLFYMNIAKECAKMSRAVRLQVGAVVVKDNNIISFSWNGMPSGWDNNCEFWEKKIEWDNPSQVYKLIEEGWAWHEDEDGGSYLRRLKTRPEVLHAESNAISKLARSSESGAGASMFITHSPCIDCAKLIYQSGVVAVYYTVDYRCSSGIEFLKRCGIKVERLDV
jgi:dCMP deaminase